MSLFRSGFGALAVVGISGCAMLSQLPVKGFYIHNAYPDDAGVVPDRAERVQVAASVYFELQREYDDPAAAAACVDELSGEDTLGQLWAYGRCAASLTVPDADIAAAKDACMRTELPAVRARFGDGVGACRVLADSAQGARLVEAVVGSGELIVAFQRDLHGELVPEALAPVPIKEGWREAMAATSRLLKADAPRAGSPVPPRSKLPGLALSGGAANGSFTAGYLHALLATREDLIAALVAQPKSVAQVEAERFGRAATTSVGTLAALSVDLYFTDPTATLTPTETAAAEKWAGGKGDRTLQRAALGVLEKAFQAEEADLFCHERGTSLDLLAGELPNALRFDPLYAGTVGTFLADFGRVITTNDFLRVSMAADIDQNVLLPLDERICKPWKADKLAVCLANQVAASITEPAYARPVDEVLTPFPSTPRLTGTWLDGGVRSGTPAAFALSMSDTRVLAISTHRSEGVPATRPANGFGILLGSVGDLIEQTRQWEHVYAPLAADRRDDETARVAAWLAPAGEEAGLVVAEPGGRLTGRLRPIFVADAPEGLLPRSAALAGYTFDPDLTGALYRWGELRGLQDFEQNRAWLGWLPYEKLFDTADGATGFRKAVETHTTAVQTELEAWVSTRLVPPPGENEEAWRKRHAASRRALLKKELKACAGPPLGEPPAGNP